MSIALSLEHFFSKDTPSVSPQSGEPPTPQGVGKGWASKEMFEIIVRNYFACNAVIATAQTMSSALHPRERSFKGFANPWQIGPMAWKPPNLSAIL